MKTPVLSDKLVQIPEPIYQSLGLQEGVELDWQLEDDRILAQPVRSGRELARRIRARARQWHVNPAQAQRLEQEQRENERHNDRREQRA
jgi:antitoxin component of MazEF toxin-antitoxin module